MRRLALTLLVLGVALLVATPIVLVALGSTLGTGFIVCPNPGVCHEEVIWTPYVAAISTLILGIVALVAAWLLNRSPRPAAS